jgi:hypothetical protein
MKGVKFNARMSVGLTGMITMIVSIIGVGITFGPDIPNIAMFIDSLIFFVLFSIFLWGLFN